jgi:hypothetical protein
VVVNTSAVELGLGTGGWHVVHWNLSRDEWSGSLGAAGRETVMKLRYTSLQVDVRAEAVEVDEPAGDVLSRTPVVVGTVHSQLAAVAVAFKHCRPDKRLVYVMTDGGALPIAISDLVWELRTRELLDATVTCGHAFGGDYEAVSVAAGLAAARSLARADAIAVAMGPGGVGTASRFGFSALESAATLDTVAALGGLPILAVRTSLADPRPRHRGVSHHTKTVLETTHAAVRIPLPRVGTALDADLGRDLASATDSLPHEIVEVDPPDIVALLTRQGLDVTTMGRAAADDAAFFATAAAAGIFAANAFQ